MRKLFQVLAIVGLVMVIFPAITFYGAAKGQEVLKMWMLGGTVLWFVCSYLGFRQNPAQRELEDEHTPVA